MSLPSDQQVTLTPETQAPTLDEVVSPPWWRTPVAALADVPAFDQQVTLTSKT